MYRISLVRLCAGLSFKQTISTVLANLPRVSALEADAIARKLTLASMLLTVALVTGLVCGVDAGEGTWWVEAAGALLVVLSGLTCWFADRTD